LFALLSLIVSASIIVVLWGMKDGESSLWQWGGIPIGMFVMLETLAGAWLVVRLRVRRCAFNAWSTEEARPVRPVPSSGRRLAWMGSAYLLACIVLAFVISAYSDGGWWSTPWIEFVSAAAFLLLAVGHLFVRPRWFAVVPVGLGLFAIALGFTLWPFATARHFGRLCRAARYGEANAMLSEPGFGLSDGVLHFRGRNATVRFNDRDDLPLSIRSGEWDNYMAH
jgi:hypothetical protein